jgi:EAL domain-containing protein (putative c-di-GMP-specific phosphodiesterase class I)
VAHTVRALNVPGVPPIQIAVNMSPKQFVVEQTGVHWGQHLKDMGVDARSIIVEITEGLLLDTRHEVIQKLRLLHEAGLQVALDDFGTGYSAMSYLLKFNLDILKIDQSFVRNVNTPGGRAIVEAVVAMAHKLGLVVVAEGVEHVPEMVFLKSIGCDFAQGYLLSRPIPPAAFKALIQQDRDGLLADRTASLMH